MNVLQRRRAHGAAMPVVIATIAILVLLALAAYFLIIRPNEQAMQAMHPQVTSAAKGPVKVTAPPANVDALSTDQLLREARKALNDQRLLAPEGNNAFAYYLKVLERQPGNQVAQDALRETFPFGANAAEQAINQGDFAEAQREIKLLAKADPENYTLTILRSKLDAQRKLAAHQKQQAAQQAEQQGAQKQHAAELAKQQAEQKASQQAQVQAQAEQHKQASAPVASERKPQPAAQPQQPSVVIQNAVLVREVKPRYPTAAVRSNLQGYVELEFTVTKQGDVRDVNVVKAEPRHVFDHAATDAVRRWKFKPALRNGKPMAVTLRRRIQFTLRR